MIKQNVFYANRGGEILEQLSRNSLRFPRRTVIALILVVALLAFELFNFDTTRYALASLLGQVSFLGIGWASILAIAFCAIDFAGLVHLFTPEYGGGQPKEVWYLMGAWLLGATMNAVMTWWAVSLTLLNHEFGNEVLSRAQLLQIVPIFVATLVWLTRILFIGALTVTGSHLVFSAPEDERASATSRRLSVPSGRPLTERAVHGRAGRASALSSPTSSSASELPHVSDEVPEFLKSRRPRESFEDARSQAAHELGAERDGSHEETSDEARYQGVISRISAASTSETDEDAQPTHRHRRVKQSPPLPARSNGQGAR